MLLSLDISEKSFGHKTLYTDLKFDIQPGEKVGLIGRNGTGKSTLMHIITGDDKDYQGEVDVKRGTVVIASRQEHHDFGDKSVLEYIQGDLNDFAKLHHIITTYPEHMGENGKKLQQYSDALERFNHLGYFQIEDELSQAMEAYQIDPAKLYGPISDLSGGQKRMIELIKVQRSRGHLALIDEPTNHMDYIAKETFVKWLAAADEAVMVITHDRDVLSVVNKIVEIRNGHAYSFKGNYAKYLKINKNQITSQVNEFDLTQRRMQNLSNDVIRFRRFKEKARDPGTIKRFKSQEQKAQAELEKLSKIEQPSFWIDRENVDELSDKLSSAYDKYKAKNIQLNTRSKKAESSRELIKVKDLSLGYDDKPLFSGINFALNDGERIRFHGRNGAGKTTLVNAIVASASGKQSSSKQFEGTITVEPELNIGKYEQEIDSKFLSMTLKAAIEQSCFEKDVPVNEQKVKQLLSEYLFNPASDGEMLIERLSGGQKARFQLIRMLLGDPHILILDEPTNHLDLPSIEEIEDALSAYKGAIIYISHDSYFADKLGGKIMTIDT
ncbi:MAG: ABC-F family ATP-binding cassette domain-containing protein [Candidatus Saccharimonadales bacterium]